MICYFPVLHYIVQQFLRIYSKSRSCGCYGWWLLVKVLWSFCYVVKLVLLAIRLNYTTIALNPCFPLLNFTAFLLTLLSHVRFHLSFSYTFQILVKTHRSYHSVQVSMSYKASKILQCLDFLHFATLSAIPFLLYVFEFIKGWYLFAIYLKIILPTSSETFLPGLSLR